MKQTGLDRTHPFKLFFPLRGNTFKKLHKETTKRENKEEEKERKRKKPHREILPPRWRIFGGAQHRLVAQTSRWSIALSSSGTCKKKDYLITWKILGIEYKIFRIMFIMYQTLNNE